MNEKPAANPLPAIMAEIERRNAATPPVDDPAVGRRWLPPEFYDQIQQAAGRHNRLTADMTPPPAASWRRPLDFLRQKLTELALFYVGRLAVPQTAVNKNLAAALTHVARELEEESSADYTPAISSRLTVNIMTASLAPGDAIGNYIKTKARLLREMGLRVRLYAAAIHPAYDEPAQLADWYVSTGQSVLWYHYSIGSPTIAQAVASRDFKIMDYHGVTPPHLFTAADGLMADLCRQGLEALPQAREAFSLAVVHSDYARQELLDQGYDGRLIHKLPLCVDRGRFLALEPPAQLAALLAETRYLLFVGRIVPQKDIVQLLHIFAELRRAQPDLRLILAGSREQEPLYQQELDGLIAALGLGEALLFAGQINQPEILAALLRRCQNLIVTSEWESFCVPLVEAMSFGAAPIAHRLPPLVEVSGPAGIIIDKARPSAAAEQILTVWRDKARQAELRAAALARAERFSDAALRDALTAFWREIDLAGF